MWELSKSVYMDEEEVKRERPASPQRAGGRREEGDAASCRRWMKETAGSRLQVWARWNKLGFYYWFVHLDRSETRFSVRYWEFLAPQGTECSRWNAGKAKMTKKWNL